MYYGAVAAVLVVSIMIVVESVVYPRIDIVLVAVTVMEEVAVMVAVMEGQWRLLHWNWISDWITMVVVVVRALAEVGPVWQVMLQV
jgi:hypothetical protein